VQRGQVDEAPPDGPPPWQRVAFARLERTERPIEAHHPIPGVGDAGVALEPLVKGDALLLQPAEPVLADEFAVSQQGSDPCRAEHLEETFHQGDALGGVGVAGRVEDTPKQWHGDAQVGDAEHQEVDDRLTELLDGAVQRQPPGALADRDQAGEQASQTILVDLEPTEEALQALPPWPCRRSQSPVRLG